MVMFVEKSECGVVEELCSDDVVWVVGFGKADSPIPLYTQRVGEIERRRDLNRGACRVRTCIGEVTSHGGSEQLPIGKEVTRALQGRP